ncbi:MAG: Fic family protein [Lacipirellulaceae bacterium]
MQYNDFGPHSPGQLSAITAFWGGDRCFDPSPLPPEWRFPEPLWPLLNEANRQLMLLEGVARSLPNPAILLGPMRDREAILSSRMEGTFATPRQLLLYEVDPQLADSEHDPRNQHREVANYAKAFEHAVASPLPVGLTLIRQLHQLLMDGVRGVDREPGKIRTRQVAIGSGARFIPPPPERLADFLGDLNAYLHTESSRFDPLVDCFLVHYQFEAIHPFADGNGRVGRLLLTLMVQQRCGLSLPWLHLSEYFDRDHDEYCGHLYRVSSRGGWSSWIEYCLKGVVELAAQTVQRCDRLRSLREDYYRRLSLTKGAVRLNEIVEGLFRTPIVTASDLPSRMGVTLPTAYKDAEKLESLGIVRLMEGHYPKTYYAPEIFAIAYEGLEQE